MKETVEFKCTGDNLEEIPENLVAEKGISFPSAYLNKKEMSRLAKELKVYKGDCIVRLPFCVTVEAEALGAKIKLGDNKNGPRVGSYAFDSIDQLANIEPMDLTRGRIKELLDSIDMLSREGEVVALSVEGPFTIMSSLIDPILFYKGMRQNPDLIKKFMQVIEDSLVKYILTGLAKGAKIISYGDPVGSLDIVGPKVYRELSGIVSYNILKRVEGQLGNAIIHLCGKTSTAFEKFGLIQTVRIERAVQQF